VTKVDEVPAAPCEVRRRRRSPLTRALRQPIGLVGVLVGCLLAWRDAMHSGLMDDVFWHRAAGVWMLNHHRVMRSDVFSYTVAGHRWITPEWGYGVLLAESVRLIGPVAFWLLSAGVATLTVICVAVRCRLQGAGWLWTGLLCIEAGAAITLFLEDRPQVISYLFFALLLLLLRLARRRVALLWLVPVLFVVWANLHGSFLLGLLVLVLEAVLCFVPLRLGRMVHSHPLPRRPALMAVAGGALATLVNPFGPGVYGSAVGVSFNSTIRAFVAEWQSPDFHDPTTIAVIVVPLAFTVGYLAISNRPVPLLDVALTALLLVATLDSFRFLPYFAIAWCGLSASCSPLPDEQLRPTALTWVAGAILALAMLQGPWTPAGQPAAGVPVAAVDYLAHHPGRVFSTYLWNDYLIWRGMPVFIDGRTELYTGTPVFGEYLAVDDLTTNPDRVLRTYGVRYVLWPPRSALSVYLSHDRLWRLVRASKDSEIFRYAGP
jgi:hypothetical protein